MLRVIQITDCHVSATADALYRDCDPRASLREVVQTAIQWSPDLVLLTGDLAEDGSEAAYAWLADAFAGFEVPILATPGNHDDAELMQRYFPRTSIEEPEVFSDTWRVVVLNSAKPNEISGSFTAQQMASFKRVLEADSTPVMVALHHQPVPVGSPWIDRYPLLDPQRFWAALSDNVELVCWGHVHQALTVKPPGDHAILGVSGPSSVSNSVPERERFTLDKTGPACRWFLLQDEGGFRTGLLRPVS